MTEITQKTVKGGHVYYDQEGRAHPGVTSVLGIIGGQALINWAPNEAVNHILKEFDIEVDEKHEPILDRGKCRMGMDIYEIPYAIPKIFKAARTKHILIRDAAGDRGRAIHSAFENRLKKEKISPSFLSDEWNRKVVSNFDRWLVDTELEMVESELKLVNPDGSYGGTVDIIAHMKDKGLALGDFKTGKSIQKTVAYQMAAYAVAYGMATGNYPDTAFVLHVLKSGNIKEKFVMNRKEYEKAYDAFVHLTEFYKDYQERK
jgi:hypothetical protein